MHKQNKMGKEADIYLLSFQPSEVSIWCRQQHEIPTKDCGRTHGKRYTPYGLSGSAHTLVRLPHPPSVAMAKNAIFTRLSTHSARTDRHQITSRFLTSCTSSSRGVPSSTPAAGRRSTTPTKPKDHGRQRGSSRVRLNCSLIWSPAQPFPPPGRQRSNQRWVQ